jgi:hypothetical protein
MNMWHGGYDPAYNIPTPPPWWMYPPQQPKTGKKGKNKTVGKRPTLSQLLKEAIDNREFLDDFIERAAKKGKGDEKKEDKKKHMFSTWDTMFLLTVLALPCSLFQLGIAKAVLFGLKVLVNN